MDHRFPTNSDRCRHSLPQSEPVRWITKLPNARLLIVPSAGHVTALLKADIVLPAVVRFFEENLVGKTR